jgi:hypothetical protein
MCLKKQITPKYALIKVPNTSPAAKATRRKAETLRIKEEIKFLYAKKQHLNLQLLHTHLLSANQWQNSWPYIQHTIEEKLEKIFKQKYQSLNAKIEKLSREQTITPKTTQQFYPRVINNMDISFSEEENSLLEKGLKYDLHPKKKDWLKNLALEAETAITLLPTSDRDYYRKRVADKIKTMDARNHPHRNHGPPSEIRIIKSIKEKLTENNAMIAQADKGKSIVILPSQQYTNKVQNFITNNQFQVSKVSHQHLPETIKENHKPEQSPHTPRFKMEIHKHETISPYLQRPNKITQTKPSNPSSGQLAEHPGL